MSDIWKIVLTAAFTVVGGVIIYVLGHLLEVIFIEPIQRFRSLTGEIADSLVYYSNIYSNAGTVEREKMDEASEVYRHEASRLRAEKYAIPCYDFWAFLHFTRTTKEVEEASQKLIYLSNAVYGGPGIDLIHNIKQAEEANELLGIKKKIQKKRGDKFEINVAMLSHGVLLFSFSQILLAFKVRSIDIYFWHIDYPSWFSGLYKGFGVIALVVSAVALLGVFNKHVGGKFDNLLDIHHRSWRALGPFLYFIAFWIVFLASWLQGLSLIPQGFFFQLAFWFGFVWFIAIGVVLEFFPLISRGGKNKQRRESM